jgi:MFS family permease
MRLNTRFLFLNIGHATDHLMMLLFPAVVVVMATEFEGGYSEMLPLATGGFIAFGVFSLPAGWLADRWSREGMIGLFFLGIGSAAIATSFASTDWQIALGLFAIGMFAAIYHPVGIAMVSQGGGAVGKRLGVNGVWGNMGVAASALTAGALADAFGWRAAFLSPACWWSGSGSRG